MEIIDRILQLVEDKNITPNKLLVECKLPSSAMTFWKNGEKKPGLNALIKIADYFNVSLDYLVGRETPINNATKQNTQNNATTSPLSSRILRLNEFQQAKVMAYIDGLQGADDVIAKAFHQGQKEEQAKELKGGVTEKIKKSI